MLVNETAQLLLFRRTERLVAVVIILEHGRIEGLRARAVCDPQLIDIRRILWPMRRPVAQRSSLAVQLWRRSTLRVAAREREREDDPSYRAHDEATGSQRDSQS